MIFGPLQRRQVLTLLGGTAAAWPLAARAQQPGGMRRVGVLMTGKPTDATSPAYLAAFIESLQKSGWIDGKDVRIELRWSGDEADLAGFYAAELVALAPEVILAATTDNLKALQRLTRTIPIVFTQVSDPTEQGFVASLARPGGNITGFAAYEFSIGGKWLDLLKQMVPGLRRVAAMFNPETASPSQFYLRSIEAAALSFNVEVVAAPVHEPAHIQSAIESLARAPNGGLVVLPGVFTGLRRGLIVDLAARYRLPAIYPVEGFVRSGGLMSYEAAKFDQYRGAASYVDRILKGAKPNDLPIQLPTRYLFVINRKTAGALGIEVPLGLLLAADEVIK